MGIGLTPAAPRERGAPAFRFRWRPATAVTLLLRAGLLAAVPLAVLVGGLSTAGRFAAVAAVAVLALAAAALGAARVVRPGTSHLWIGLVSLLLVVSFCAPAVRAPLAAPSERHRIVDLVGPLGALAPGQLLRLTDLVGFLAGLALLAVVVAVPPRPRGITRVIALTGTAAAVYALYRGTYDEGRLEALGCTTNYLGLMLALPLVASIGLLRRTRNVKWLVPAAACFLAIADTQSRGAFAAAACGTAVVLLQGLPRRVQGAMAVVLGAAAAAALIGGGHVLDGLGAGDRRPADLSANNLLRLQAAEFALRTAVTHPLRGVGYWMFPTYAHSSPEFGVYVMTHNDYLRLAAEAGVATLAAFAVLLVRGVRRRATGDLAVLRAVVVVYAVGMLFANPLSVLGVSAPFWLALGSLLADAPDPDPDPEPDSDYAPSSSSR
ncbi:O-antigen ligase [Actinomadura sp. WMMA1423]|uniref:O-antigen ligase family protein n=1 Tax=Actinomadura sp. WMMA1423 TaxID=2591108 RepID=UPI00143CC0F0|nr:O-antigen ligase family protein [Actinomadura sp. WMMA1423]